MIKTVVFDIDNTLYSFDRAHAAALEALISYAGQKLRMDRETFMSALKETQQRLEEYIGDKAAVHNRTIRFQHLLESRGLPLHPHVLEMDSVYWDTLIASSVPSPGALETVRELKKRGIRIGIGTDMTARVQFRKLEFLGLLPYIDFFVSSEEAGAEKPDPALFARCVEKAGCEAQECLFVGDNRKKDVLGAQNAGLKAVWYCPKGCHAEENVPVITDLTQILQMTDTGVIKETKIPLSFADGGMD